MQSSTEDCLQCLICLKSFAKRDNFSSHMKSAHQIDSEASKRLETITNSYPNLRCHDCDQDFYHKGNLRSHVAIFHKNDEGETVKEDAIDKNVVAVREILAQEKKQKDELKVKNHRIGTEEERTCDVCFLTLSRKDSVAVHKRHVHKIENRTKFIANDEPVDDVDDEAIKTNFELDQNSMLEITKVKQEEQESRVSFLDMDTTLTVVHDMNIKNEPSDFDTNVTENGASKSVVEEMESSLEIESPAKTPEQNDSKSPVIGKLTCDICFKTFSRLRNVNRHKKNVHGIGKKAEKRKRDDEDKENGMIIGDKAAKKARLSKNEAPETPQAKEEDKVGTWKNKVNLTVSVKKLDSAWLKALIKNM